MVRFLPGGSLPPEEFFARLEAQWSWIEDPGDSEPRANGRSGKGSQQPPRSAVGIADYESVEQLAIDLAIMPGAGISNVEVVPISEDMELQPTALGRHREPRYGSA